MAKYDVRIDRSYREYDCPPCPTQCTCGGTCSTCKNCDAAIGYGGLAGAIIGGVLGGPGGALAGAYVGAFFGSAACELTKKN